LGDSEIGNWQTECTGKLSAADFAKQPSNQSTPALYDVTIIIRETTQKRLGYSSRRFCDDFLDLKAIYFMCH